ncbi:Ribulose-5-phosphate 4-epimerase/Fuculose-1-phosphate aldolase [Rhizobium mongolense subsp. loessense]|uniref:3-oxo-tetronate 4-phosphate decarboxylase n=1 Tax=Rhizobium mongolense subsp. loessense TaxID=158890 RepID=A0A1G4R1E1_9HYPH|nr:3-oxo-tetronate 4-phosphate decarboxylase [Rhizobium mongolense]SCW50713.1 Ribulose-5-phosphate 4-epimerase/Fuculose-1-phosphate aldolase [Rhizobium mongolense subsp. loessense]
MTDESRIREDIVRLSKSLYDRGYSVGSAGNISAAVDDGILMTPTNSCWGFLDPAKISKLDYDGRHVSGDKPSKEVFLHRAFYETRPQTGAVVHLHSTFATALSCLEDTNPDDCIPPLTPYVVMRVGEVKLLPYVRPGDEKMGEMIRDLGGRYAAILLANHGPVVSAKDITSAVYAAEELEETAKLLVMLRTAKTRLLTPNQVQELRTVFSGY